MPTVIPVRMHFNSEDLWFSPENTGAVGGDYVIVSTERGTEFGLATRDPFQAPADETHGTLKPVLRVATDADVRQAEGLAAKGERTMPLFRQLIDKYQLDMKPAGVEYLFGGEKVVFYFAAEDRVDFRDIVRDLAARLHARVDMRQIGVRDEARLAGGYAACGQELCCARLGGKFEPVSIRMAKEQDLPLNAAKISGVCGRLMCCLRYEFEAYKDFKQRAPKRNAVIDTPLGKAKIIEYNTPRETITMRLENGKSFTIALADMTCSEGCRKRAKEQNSPLRPDTVTREALEALGTAEIMAQLADMDRQNSPDGFGYELDSSLISPRRRERAARDRGGDARGTRAPEDGAEAGGRQPRRRDRGNAAQDARQGRAQRRDGTREDAAPGEDTRPARRRGMQPRRSRGDRQQGAPAPEGAGRGAAPRRQHDVADQAAEGTATRRRRSAPRDAASAAQGQERGQAQQGQPAAGAPAPRARRHHATTGDVARPERARQQRGADRQPGDNAPAASQAPARRRQRGGADGASGTHESHDDRERRAGDGRRQRATRQDQGDAPQPRRAPGQQPAEGEAAPRPRRRHRKPGDHGGAGQGTGADASGTSRE